MIKGLPKEKKYFFKPLSCNVKWEVAASATHLKQQEFPRMSAYPHRRISTNPAPNRRPCLLQRTMTTMSCRRSCWGGEMLYKSSSSERKLKTSNLNNKIIKKTTALVVTMNVGLFVQVSILFPSLLHCERSHNADPRPGSGWQIPLHSLNNLFCIEMNCLVQASVQSG